MEEVLAPRSLKAFCSIPLDSRREERHLLLRALGARSFLATGSEGTWCGGTSHGETKNLISWNIPEINDEMVYEMNHI